MRSRSDDEPVPIEIELLGSDGVDDSDISFGGRDPGRRSRGSARAKSVAGVAAVTVIAAITLVVRNDDDSDSASVPTTEADGPSTTGAMVPVPTRFEQTPTTVGAPATAYSAPPEFALDPGFRVYVGTPSFLQAFDPSTGILEAVEAPDDLYLVIAGADGPTFLARDQEGKSGLVPVGDGTGWRLADGSLVKVDLVDQSPVELIALPPSSDSQQVGAVLIGTDATGRPVVVLPDFRAYTVAPDGSMAAFADGAITTSVSSGRYVATDCSDAGRCITTLHSGALRVPVDLDVQQLSFSGDGTHAVVFGVDAESRGVYRVVDLSTGTTVFEWADVDSSFTFYGYNTPLPGWSPDDRFFFVTVEGALQAFDTSTNSVIELVTGLPRGTVVRGVV